jgi:hypothetical protein
MPLTSITMLDGNDAMSMPAFSQVAARVAPGRTA